MTKHRWRGKLAKPIYVGAVTTLKGPPPADGYLPTWVEAELVEKLTLLMEHYKIADEDDFFSLALCLAMDHVPGFRIVPDTPLKLRHGTWGAVIHANKGRRPAWTPGRRKELLAAVEETKKKRQLSTDREALKIIARTREWGLARPGGGLDQWRKTLANQLAAARSEADRP